MNYCNTLLTNVQYDEKLPPESNGGRVLFTDSFNTPRKVLPHTVIGSILKPGTKRQKGTIAKKKQKNRSPTWGKIDLAPEKRKKNSCSQKADKKSSLMTLKRQVRSQVQFARGKTCHTRKDRHLLVLRLKKKGGKTLVGEPENYGLFKGTGKQGKCFTHTKLVEGQSLAWKKPNLDQKLPTAWASRWGRAQKKKQSPQEGPPHQGGKRKTLRRGHLFTGEKRKYKPTRTKRLQ